MGPISPIRKWFIDGANTWFQLLKDLLAKFQGID
jgi:hypothetical protein